MSKATSKKDLIFLARINNKVLELYRNKNGRFIAEKPWKLIGGETVRLVVSRRRSKWLTKHGFVAPSGKGTNDPEGRTFYGLTALGRKVSFSADYHGELPDDVR